MRPSKRGRGVRARTLSLSLFVLGLVTAFTRNAAAADPLAVQKTAPLSDADRKTLLSERDRFDRESAALQAKGQYAEAMAAAASAVHDQAAGTSTSAAKSSQDLVAVAAAVEQLTSSVAEIARQVHAVGERRCMFHCKFRRFFVGGVNAEHHFL